MRRDNGSIILEVKKEFVLNLLGKSKVTAKRKLTEEGNFELLKECLEGSSKIRATYDTFMENWQIAIFTNRLSAKFDTLEFIWLERLAV